MEVIRVSAFSFSPASLVLVFLVEDNDLTLELTLALQ